MAQHILVKESERPDVFEKVKQIITDEFLNLSKFSKNSIFFKEKRTLALHNLSKDFIEKGDNMVFSIAPFDFSEMLGCYCKNISVEIHLDKSNNITKMYAVA